MSIERYGPNGEEVSELIEHLQSLDIDQMRERGETYLDRMCTYRFFLLESKKERLALEAAEPRLVKYRDNAVFDADSAVTKKIEQAKWSSELSIFRVIAHVAASACVVRDRIPYRIYLNLVNRVGWQSLRRDGEAF